MTHTVDNIIHALEREGYDVYEDGNLLYVQVPDGNLAKLITDAHLDDIYDIASLYDSVDVWKNSISDAIVQVGVS